MANIPVTSFDSTFLFLQDPYHFVWRTCDQEKTNIFQTRIMGRKTICLTGHEAAKFFYNEPRLVRKGGMPEPLVSTLMGKGGIQNIDGEKHKRRKKMFMLMMTPQNVKYLVDLVEFHWEKALPAWSGKKEILLYDELMPILTQSVCEWAGIPLPRSEVGKQTARLRSLFDDAGRGARNLRARWARRQVQNWIGDIVCRERNGFMKLPDGSPAKLIAWYQDEDGQYLSEKNAADEIINLLRPTVAVAVYMTFVAHALYEHSHYQSKIARKSDIFNTFFAQEVRRFYPFFPAVSARVQSQFEWNGYVFPEGARVLLDLHGINHDPRVWNSPQTFFPERFQLWNGDLYNFVPQGGGDHWTQHRCPGERITIELMKMASVFLATRISYTLPNQEMSIDERRLPALPKSHFVMSNVKLKVGRLDQPLQI
ncbi:cytochrome P450 [Bdellovibrio sp. HCB2-146]|uniref:cytochrome P450 n=1 Tax=Bdellovibrio sp. HCB2-146 TaxID=3394362 RepID=UPI0039BD72E8